MSISALLGLSCAVITTIIILSTSADVSINVFLAAVFLFVYFGASALFMSFIGPRFVRLNAVPSAINATLRAMRLIRAVRDINRSIVKPARLRRFQKERRSAHRGLQLNAWRIAGFLAVSAGRSPRERDHPHSATLGKWLVYASENLDKSECLNYTMQVCADSIKHLVEGKPWESLSLPSVPKVLPLEHPSHWQGRLRYLSRTALVSLIPIAAAVVGALLRK